MTTPPAAYVVSVNVVHHLRPGFLHDTAIDKRPQEGPVRVAAAGLEGDRQMDRTHGGRDRAVYAYAEEDADVWSAELGRDIPPGTFGENLRTRGLDVCGAEIGEQWRVGDAVLEVCMPRTPCENLSMRMGIERFHVRFNRSGRVGAMLRVLEPGWVSAGDPVERLAVPGHGVTVAALATAPSVEQLRSLLDSGVRLADRVRSRARRATSVS